jgi:MFS family permease
MLLPEMMRELNLTNAQASLIYTAYLTVYTITSLFVGFLIDSAGIKKTVLAFLPLLGIGTALMGLVSNQLWGIVFFSVAGVGASIGWVPLVVWVQKAYPSRRGWSLGVLYIGDNLGFSILGLLMPLMIPYLGWRVVWTFLGCLTLIWLLPLTAIAKESDVDSPSQKSISLQMRKSSGVLKETKFWLGGISYALSAFAMQVPMTFSKAYATVELGLKAAEATAIFSIIGFTAIFGAFFISMLSDKVGRKFSITVSNLALAVGFVGSVFFSASFTEIALWSVIIGLGRSIVPLYAALVKDLYSWDVAGSISGLWTLLGGVGLLLSPYVCGILIDHTGSYKPAYLLGTVMAIAAALLILRILSRRK